MTARRYYYADAVLNRSQIALLAGPFDTEAEAREALPSAKYKAIGSDPRASFAAFGTCSFAQDQGPGRFNP